MATKAKAHNTQSTSADPVAAEPSTAETHAVTDAPQKPKASPKPRKKKAAPGTELVSSEQTPRTALHTVEERLRALRSIASLQKPIDILISTQQTAETEAEIDANAPPPPNPIPPPEDEPAPSGMVDRGAPVPEHYSMDRMVVLIRDPHWLYLYWELKGGALERLRFQHSAEIIDNSRWVLNVKTLHVPQAPTPLCGANQFIVDIDVRIGQWYLKVSPSTTFHIELGFIDPQDNFVKVLHSNEVHTPVPAVSNVMDERWMIQREELERLIKVSGQPHPAAPFPVAHVGALGSSQAIAQVGRSETPRALGLFSSHSVIRN